MDTKIYKSFVTLSQVKSYSETAKLLGISQPTVTTHIKKLEDYYGVKLVEKHNNQYTCNSYGLILLTYAQQIVNLFEESSDYLNRFHLYDKKTLKIATTAQGTYILPEIIKKINQTTTNTNIFFKTTNTHETLESLKNHEVDLALAPLQPKNVENTDEFDFIKLGYDELLLISSLENHLSKVNNVTLKDLKNEKFLLREKGSMTREIFKNWLIHQGFSPNKFYEIGHSEAILSAVNQDLGISLMSNLTLRSQFNKYNVIQFNGFPIKRYFYLISRKNEQYNSVIIKLIVEAREFFKQLQYI